MSDTRSNTLDEIEQVSNDTNGPARTRWSAAFRRSRASDAEEWSFGVHRDYREAVADALNRVTRKRGGSAPGFNTAAYWWGTPLGGCEVHDGWGATMRIHGLPLLLWLCAELDLEPPRLPEDIRAEAAMQLLIFSAGAAS